MGCTRQWTASAHRWASSGGFFDAPAKQNRLKELEAAATQPAFWDAPQEAQKVLKETAALKDVLKTLEDMDRRLEDLKAHEELAREYQDAGEAEEVSKGLTGLEAAIKDLMTRAKLAGAMDRKNAIISL